MQVDTSALCIKQLPRSSEESFLGAVSEESQPRAWILVPVRETHPSFEIPHIRSQVTAMRWVFIIPDLSLGDCLVDKYIRYDIIRMRRMKK